MSLHVLSFRWKYLASTWLPLTPARDVVYPYIIHPPSNRILCESVSVNVMFTMNFLSIRVQRALVRGPILRTHFHTAHALLAARKVLHTFKLADIGEGITECEVIKWSVCASLPVICTLLLTSTPRGTVLQVRQGTVARAEFRYAVRSPERQGERRDYLAV